VFRRKRVIARDADQEQARTWPRRLDGILKSVPYPGSLEHEINTTPVRLLEEHRHSFRPGSRKRHGAQFSRQRTSPRKLLTHEDLTGTRPLCGLQDQKTYRSRPDDESSIPRAEVREVHGMERDTEGLKERGGGIVYFRRHRETGGRGNDHSLDQASVVRPESTEVKCRAEIWIAPEAHLASAAGLCGINGNPCAGGKRVSVAIHRSGAHVLYDGREFMARDQRFQNDRVANPRVAECVEIAPADADRTDGEARLRCPRVTRFGNVVDGQTSRSVESCSQHVLSFSPACFA
jgi:hypothetical protein